MINSPISVDPRPDRSDSSLVWAPVGPIRRGVVTDISASGLDATASDLLTRESVFGAGYRNGENSTGSGLSSGATSVLDGVTEFTLCGLMRTSKATYQCRLIAKDVNYIEVKHNGVKCSVYGSAYTYLNHAVTLSDGLFHSYVYTFKSGEFMRLYIDGEQVKTQAVGAVTTRSISGAFTAYGTGVFPLNGDGTGAAAYSVEKSAAWVKAQWNRLAPACRLYIPPYSASLPGQIPLGTVVGPAWIPRTPIYVYSAISISAETDEIDGRDEAVLRWIAGGALVLYSDRKLNGSLGSSAEMTVGEWEFWANKMTTRVTVDLQSVTSGVRFQVIEDGSATILRQNGATEAAYASGTVSASVWHHHRLRLDKTAAGTSVTWWLDGELKTPSSGSNPTARWTVPVTGTTMAITCGIGAKFSLTGLAKHPTWSLT